MVVDSVNLKMAGGWIVSASQPAQYISSGRRDEVLRKNDPEQDRGQFHARVLRSASHMSDTNGDLSMRR